MVRAGSGDLNVTIAGLADSGRGASSCLFSPRARRAFRSGAGGRAGEPAGERPAATGRLLPADVSEIPPDVVAYGGNLISACKYSEAPEQALVKIAEHEDAPVLTPSSSR